MIMKLIAILSLILVFWCHSSHHHLFMLINSGPLSLASEEFIPVGSEVVPNLDKVPSSTSSPDVVDARAGSQNDKKSDSTNYDDKEVNVQDGKAEDHHYAPDTNLPVSSKESDKLLNSKESLPTTEKQTAQSQIPTPGVNAVSEEANNHGADAAENVVNHDKDDHLSGIPKDSSSEVDLSKSPIDRNNSETDSINFATLGNDSVHNQTRDSLESEIPSIPTKVEPPAPSASVVHPSATQKEEEPIPSFMEWAQIQQQKLHESNQANGITGSGQANGQNGHRTPNSGSSQQNKSSLTGHQAVEVKSRKESNAKNFASPDCGAKVIQSNPESQNANGVLSSSHDEYMLNKCGIPIWFIVELCEPLKIEKVSLGNLELFSSSPKDVEIGISDRYPTRDWTKLGPFTLPDLRAIHSITFPATNASTFGKFLKVNILSHYGEEHFCPLSLVRVNGISEYEVLESENIHPGDIDATDKEESALYEEPVIADGHPQATEGKPADKSVFGTAKDAVINIVKKAAQVLVKSDNKKDASHAADGTSQSNCRSLLQCLPNYEIQFREKVSSLLSCNFSNLLPFLRKQSPWCGWDYCHALFNKHSIGLPWQPEGFYASIFGGPTVLHALCHYHRPLTKESCDPFTGNVSAKSPDNVLEEGTINETVRTPPVKIGTSTEEAKEKHEETMHDSIMADTDTNRVEGNGKTIAEQSAQVIPEPVVAPPISGTGEDQQRQQQASTPATPSPVASNEEASPVVQPPISQIPPPANNQQQHQGGSGQQQQQKESVFVRLSNRIKTLERNQTLTASYLEELSRRFKKQNEENHHTNEGTKTFMNDSRVKFKVLEDLYRFELRSLRRNTDEIRERLFNVQLQRSVLILLCLLQFIGIVSVCLWVRKRFRQLESQMQNTPQINTNFPAIMPSTPRPSISSRGETPQHNILAIRKRLNSELSTGSSLNSIDKSKKIKKKKKKLPDLKPVNSKISGPASAPLDYSRNKQDSEFKFNYPPPPSSSSAYDVVHSSYNFKENINPIKIEPHISEATSSSSLRKTPPPTTPNGSSFVGSNVLSTQVDSPFAMMTSTSTNFFAEPGVSTSSRFALLASPGPGGGTAKVQSMKRSGSLTSLDSSSTSSYGAKTGSHNVVNGHGDNQSQGSNGSGKKRKNKGLKALMPKIFDR